MFVDQPLAAATAEAIGLLGAGWNSLIDIGGRLDSPTTRSQLGGGVVVANMFEQ